MRRTEGCSARVPHILWSYIAVATTLALLFIIYSASAGIAENGSELLLNILFCVALAAMLLVGGIGFWLYKTIGKVRIYKIAAINQLPVLIDSNSPRYEGLVFKTDHNIKTITAALFFPGNIEIGNYKTVDQDKNNRTTINWGYVRLKLLRQLPHMLLDAMREIVDKHGTKDPAAVRDTAKILEKHSLEGKAFNLLAKQHAGREVCEGQEAINRYVDLTGKFIHSVSGASAY